MKCASYIKYSVGLIIEVDVEDLGGTVINKPDDPRPYPVGRIVGSTNLETLFFFK